MRFNKDNLLTVVELFAGYGSQRIALERLRRDYPDFDYKVLAISEIDKNALATYEAIHGDCPNLGSVTDIAWELHPELKGIGLLTYSFPCQDISSAGKQRGFDKGSGTRSSLLWECERAISILHPKYLLMENVSAIMHKKALPCFREWQACLEEYGYTNFVSLLNSADFGCPQHRERVFMVSILGDKATFEFPKPFPLEKRLRDVLEDNVPENYYLKDEQIQRILAHCERKQVEGCGFKVRFISSDGICGAITGNYGQRETDTYLQTESGIRRFTEREVFHLMGMDDVDIDKIDAYRIQKTLKTGKVKVKPISKSAKYRMAGNSIVIDCLYHIFYQMFIAEPPKPQPKQLTLFD